jgi:hypothetical protein
MLKAGRTELKSEVVTSIAKSSRPSPSTSPSSSLISELLHLYNCRKMTVDNRHWQQGAKQFYVCALDNNYCRLQLRSYGTAQTGAIICQQPAE